MPPAKRRPGRPRGTHPPLVNTERLAVRIPEALAARLDDYAARASLTRADALRALLDEHLP